MTQMSKKFVFPHPIFLVTLCIFSYIFMAKECRRLFSDTNSHIIFLWIYYLNVKEYNFF